MNKAKKHKRVNSSFVRNNFIYRRTDGRGTDGTQDVNGVGNGLAVGGTDIPCIYTVVSSFTSSPYFWQPTNIDRA